MALIPLLTTREQEPGSAALKRSSMEYARLQLFLQAAERGGHSGVGQDFADTFVSLGCAWWKGVARGAGRLALDDNFFEEAVHKKVHFRASG